MSLVFVWKEMEPTVVQELKKTTATKKHLGLNPQISVCETGTLTGSFTQVCSGRMKAFSLPVNALRKLHNHFVLIMEFICRTRACASDSQKTNLDWSYHGLFPLRQFPLRQFPFGQLPILSIQRFNIPLTTVI